jgi:hypothetical protein
MYLTMPGLEAIGAMVPCIIELKPAGLRRCRTTLDLLGQAHHLN